MAAPLNPALWYDTLRLPGRRLRGDTALWQRIDTPGHDVCRLTQIAEGWKLQGTAVFRHELGPASLEYVVECNASWQCRSGQIRGWIAAYKWQLVIERTEHGMWSLNHVSIPGLEDCLDLDFGFTPATNLTQLRRVNLAIGGTADVPVAWIDLPEASLSLLPQRYERRTASTYWYESPTANYSGLLKVTDSGFAEDYPRLWRLVSAIPSAENE